MTSLRTWWSSSGWFVALALVVLGSGAPLHAQQTDPQLVDRVLQRSDGVLYVYRDGFKYWVVPAALSDEEIDAIPEAGPALTALSGFFPPPSPTPSPTPTPAPTRVPVQSVFLEGRGDKVIYDVPLPSPFTVARLTHDGARNVFASASLSKSTVTLAIAIGPYSGTSLIETGGDGTATITVRADGAWTLRLEDLSSGGTPRFEGRANGVSALFDAPSDGVWDFTHGGRNNFLVELFCGTRRIPVQNQIGIVRASAQVSFPPGQCFWRVQADGAWTLTPRQN